MSRRFLLVTIAASGIVAATTAIAQQHRPYNQIMSDVGTTFASLKKNLDSNSAAAAAADAAKLEGLFTETEAFWAPLDTQDAVKFAKGATDAASAVGTAAKSDDMIDQEPASVSMFWTRTDSPCKLVLTIHR